MKTPEANSAMLSTNCTFIASVSYGDHSNACFHFWNWLVLCHLNWNIRLYDREFRWNRRNSTDRLDIQFRAEKHILQCCTRTSIHLVYKPLTQIIFIYDDEHLDIFNVVKIVQKTTIEFEFGINLVSVLFTLMSIAMEQNSSLKPIYTVGILWKYLPFSKINCLINMIRFALNAKFRWNGYKYRDLCLLHFEQTQSDISCNIFFHSLHEIKWVSKMILSLRFRIQNWNKRIKMMCVDVGFLDQSTWNPVLLVHQLQFIHIKCFTSLRFNVWAIILFMHSLCPR